jgi:hypothetical protein
MPDRRRLGLFQLLDQGRVDLRRRFVQHIHKALSLIPAQLA